MLEARDEHVNPGMTDRQIARSSGNPGAGRGSDECETGFLALVTCDRHAPVTLKDNIRPGFNRPNRGSQPGIQAVRRPQEGQGNVLSVQSTEFDAKMVRADRCDAVSRGPTTDGCAHVPLYTVCLSFAISLMHLSRNGPVFSAQHPIWPRDKKIEKIPRNNSRSAITRLGAAIIHPRSRPLCVNNATLSGGRSSSRPAPGSRGGCAANGCPGRARCPFEHPGDVTTEPLSQLDGGLEEPPDGRRGVQVQVIPGGAAFETSVEMQS